LTNLSGGYPLESIALLQGAEFGLVVRVCGAKKYVLKALIAVLEH
jgi:hypothetical protein